MCISQFGLTPLILASSRNEYGVLPAIKMLLKKGANVSAESDVSEYLINITLTYRSTSYIY